MNCERCRTRFRVSEEGTPRTFPCGHCYCTECIAELLTQCPSRQLCPACGRPIEGESVDDFPKNYKLLDIIRRQKKKQSQTSQQTHEAVRAKDSLCEATGVFCDVAEFEFGVSGEGILR